MREKKGEAFGGAMNKVGGGAVREHVGLEEGVRSCGVTSNAAGCVNTSRRTWTQRWAVSG
jgi:hypothetical protein